MGNQLADGFQPREVHRNTRHEQEEAVDFEILAAWAYSWEGAAQQVARHHNQPGLEVEHTRQQYHDEGE